MMNLNTAARDATLELCDVIIADCERTFDTSASVELCEHIVAQVEYRHLALEIDRQAREIFASLPEPEVIDVDVDEFMVAC
jgi:hypothetical protein